MNEVAQYIFLPPASFTPHDVSERHPCCHRCQRFVPLIPEEGPVVQPLQLSLASLDAQLGALILVRDCGHTFLFLLLIDT